MGEQKFIDLLRKTKWSKWAHRFSVTLQGLLKIKCRRPALDFTRNRISWSFWPTEKAGRAVRSGQFARSKSAEVRVASGDLKRPQAFWSTDRADRRDRSPLKGVKGERLAQWYDAVRHILLGIIWRKMAADPAAPLLRTLPASCWNERNLC